MREHVLVKAKKLYEPSSSCIRQRFELIKRGLELGTTRRKLDWIAAAGRRGYAAAGARWTPS